MPHLLSEITAAATARGSMFSFFNKREAAKASNFIKLCSGTSYNMVTWIITPRQFSKQEKDIRVTMIKFFFFLAEMTMSKFKTTKTCSTWLVRTVWRNYGSVTEINATSCYLISRLEWEESMLLRVVALAKVKLSVKKVAPRRSRCLPAATTRQPHLP